MTALEYLAKTSVDYLSLFCGAKVESPEDLKRAEVIELKDRLPDYNEIESLVRIGFLSPDEASKYKEKPTSLPEDKKSLIVYYFLCSNIVDYSIKRKSWIERTKRVVEKVGIDTEEWAKSGLTLFEYLGEERNREYLLLYYDAITEERLDLIREFVLGKRRRIREQLLKVMLFEIVYRLNEEEAEVDNIAHLRELAQSKGYRAKAKSLTEEDRHALKDCASYYLDLIEACLLNGVGEERNKKIESLYDENGDLKETYYYEDEIDEVFMEYSHIYTLVKLLYTIAINDTLTGVANALKIARQLSKTCLLSERGLESVRESKFKEFAEGVAPFNRKEIRKALGITKEG